MLLFLITGKLKFNTHIFMECPSYLLLNQQMNAELRFSQTFDCRIFYRK